MEKQSKQNHRQKTGKIGLIQLLFTAVIMGGLMLPSAALTKDWGQLMVAPAKTNIHAERTVGSKLFGYLEAGQKVKADFFKDDWYAIFPPYQQVRLEESALGYVHATQLKNLDTIRTATTTEEPIVVRGIRVIPGTGDQQTVFIALSRLSVPRLISIQGENPRLVIDFSNVSSVGKDLTNIEVGSTLIRRIRSSLDAQKHTFRVVLDLNKGKDYTVNQKFYEAEKLYTLILSEDKITEVR
jgi:hypothetical protein